MSCIGATITPGRDISRVTGNLCSHAVARRLLQVRAIAAIPIHRRRRLRLGPRPPSRTDTGRWILTRPAGETVRVERGPVAPVRDRSWQSPAGKGEFRCVFGRCPARSRRPGRGIALAGRARARSAADGMTETGTTTYVVIPGQERHRGYGLISDHNDKPDTVTTGCYTYYFWVTTDIAVEAAGRHGLRHLQRRAASPRPRPDTDTHYRYMTLNYANVYYGQTRVVTATYTIPAGPGRRRRVPRRQGLRQPVRDRQRLRHGICLGGRSRAGFALHVDAGDGLTNACTSGDEPGLSSGTQASPYKFWTCVDAENPANLTQTQLTPVDQTLRIEAGRRTRPGARRSAPMSAVTSSGSRRSPA